VLRILDVIGVSTTEFFGELFYYQPTYPAAAGGAAATAAPGAAAAAPESSYRELSDLLRGLLRVLIERKVIEPDDLQAAIRAADGGTGDPPGNVN
jgi:hypothetical protein